jgi:hypothetical protein
MKTIKYAGDNQSFTPIISTKSDIPEWYKEYENYNNKHIKFLPSGKAMANIKNCMPYFDAITCGYFVTLQSDLYIEKAGSSIIIRSSSLESPVQKRIQTYKGPFPEGCYSESWSWKFPYHILAPKGSSLLITHPINRFDLPFVSMTGLVDGGEVMTTGSMPVFFKTPIFQIIPFSQEPWKMEQDENVRLIAENLKLKKRSKFYGWYKQNVWTRKQYDV